MTSRARLGLLALLLLPSLPASAGPAPSGCHVAAPGLTVEAARACERVLLAVPDWDGRARVQLVDGDAAVAGETSGAVVLLHRQAWERLSPAGRQVVLAHELVHVATGPLTTDRTPGWLAEGLAESVALAGSGFPDRVAGRELAGRRPAFPTEEELAQGEPVAYQEAWLAVDLLRQRHGVPAVLRLYDESGRGSWQAALQRLTGEPLAAFVRDWQAAVARRLSGSGARA